MNSRERTLAAINGLPHDRVPVAQHNFAFAARHVGMSMKEFAYHPERAAQALADTAHDFGYDCIIIDFDTCTLAEAMGATITFPGDEPARVVKAPLQTIQEAVHLKVPDPQRDGRLPLWLETTRILRRIVGEDFAIMGAGLTKVHMVCVGLLRDPQMMMMDLIEQREEDIFAGLEVCVTAGVAFAKAQLAAGGRSHIHRGRSVGRIVDFTSHVPPIFATFRAAV